MAQIIATHLQHEGPEAIQPYLIDYFRSLRRVGATQVECMIVIGALRVVGFTAVETL